MSFDLTKNMPQSIKSNLQEAQTRIEDIEDAKGVANGFAELDANGKVPVSQIPDVSKITREVVADLTAMYALTTATVQLGDIVTVTAEGDTFQLVNEAEIDNADGWIKIQLSNSDDVAEGSSNLYFTEQRAKDAVVAEDMSGSEDDKAGSVADVKQYVADQIAAISRKFVKKSATGAIAATEEKIYSNITSDNITLTLPSVGSSEDGRSHLVMNKSSSTKNVIVAASDSDTVDGGANLTLLPGEYVEFIYEHSATDWFVKQ
jgi:hypothetical protein